MHSHLSKGNKTSNNCYLLTSSGTCCTTLLNNSYIWHRRFGHVSHKNLDETIVADVVLGIPKIKIDFEKVCGPCQIGKYIRMSHKMVQHPSTTRVLELLHMDLMGPMQIESLGGKMEHMSKFDVKSYDDIFMGYSPNSRAYRYLIEGQN